MNSTRELLRESPFFETFAPDDIDALAARLQDEGAASFTKSWNELMACIDGKSARMRKAG